MSDKKKVYSALIEGAEAGLSARTLYDFVQHECGKTSSKKIVRASLLALTDPKIKDANILHVVYDLAIRHRVDKDPYNDVDIDDDDNIAIHSEPVKAIASEASPA